MKRYDYDVIVIGGGAAGLTASTACASVGAKTLLVEKEPKLGGDCLHYGCVPSKSLIKSAAIYHAFNHATEFGLPRLNVPAVDFQQVSRRIHSIIDSIQVRDEPSYLKRKYKVHTSFGSPKFLDNHTIILNGGPVSTKKFILATGSSPAIPPIEGLKDVPYITNVEVFSLQKLPKTMIVLGAGPIGLEMAQAFTRLGTKVTVVEFAPHVLPREDEDVSMCVENILREEGTELVLSSKGTYIEHKSGQFHLTTEKNGEKSVHTADQLLVATGRVPNVEGLDLSNAGVQFDKKGIIVDRRLRTSARNIFACGDVNGSFPFTHVAAYEAGIAMMNAVFYLPLKADYATIPWCTYTDPEVASIGYNEKRARDEGLTFMVHKEDLKHNDRAKTEGETNGFVKLIINNRGVLIGCQIVAFHAGDLIHEWVAAINGKLSLSTIANAVHAYPTLSEVNKSAALNYFLKASVWTKIRLLLNWRG